MDGTSNTVFAGESNGIIAILIGLLLPAVQRDQRLVAGAHASSFHLMAVTARPALYRAGQRVLPLTRS